MEKSLRQVAQFLVRNARKRAKKLQVPFDIEWRDIEVPEVCPILQVPMQRNLGKQMPNSFTLDRRVPELGYVKGNVFVMSLEANRAKGALTIEQLKRLIEYIEE